MDPAATQATVVDAAPAETTPLLQTSPAGDKSYFEIVTLKFRYLLKGLDSTQKAFENDTLAKYILEMDTYPFKTIRRKIRGCVGWLGPVYHKRILTIDNGTAILMYAAPGDEDPQPWIVGFLLRAFLLWDPPKLKRRRLEASAVAEALTAETLGEKKADMWCIEGLATNPAAQGRGYGSALMRYILDKSDADGHDTYLSTIDTHPYYETFGFKTTGTRLVGVDDPDWRGEPITYRLMVRPSALKTAANVESD